MNQSNDLQASRNDRAGRYRKGLAEKAVELEIKTLFKFTSMILSVRCINFGSDEFNVRYRFRPLHRFSSFGLEVADLVPKTGVCRTDDSAIQRHAGQGHRRTKNRKG